MQKSGIDNSEKYKVKLLINSNEQAFSDLFTKYAKKVYFVCRKLQVDHAGSEDVVQKVFLKIWKNRSNLKPELSFNAYVLTITKSIVLKLKRRQAYDLAYKQYAIKNINNYSSNTEDQVIFSDLETFSKEKLEALPKQQRQIFLMKTQENLTIEQISGRLEISKRTAENHFYRACKKLKAQLKQQKVI